MKTFPFFLFLFISSLCLAQQTELNGIVTLQNSGKKPVQGAQVSALWTTATTTNTDGQFKLVFIRKKPGDEVSIQVEKTKQELPDRKETTDLEVVNKKELLLALPTPDKARPIKIYMCPKGEWAKKMKDFRW